LGNIGEVSSAVDRHLGVEMKYSAYTIQAWISEINFWKRNLTDWEKRYVNKVERQLVATGSVTPHQIEVIEMVYVQRVSHRKGGAACNQ